MDGAVAVYVHDYLKIGDELVMRGPYGDFFLRQSDRNILLIATGSGLAPIMSILYQMEKEKIRRESLLFFGARTPADLYRSDRIEAVRQSLPRFRFIPVLSRPAETDNWTGEVGRGDRPDRQTHP